MIKFSQKKNFIIALTILLGLIIIVNVVIIINKYSLQQSLSSAVFSTTKVQGVVPAAALSEGKNTVTITVNGSNGKESMTREVYAQKASH